MNEEDEYKAAFPLHYSVIVGDVDKVQSLLASESVDINQKDNIGNTSLHYAACNKSGKDEYGFIVEYLLLTGAKVNEKDDNKGNTPLHLAASSGNINAIHLLLQHKANLLLQNNDDKTPKDLAEGDTKELLEEATSKKQKATNSLFSLCTAHITLSSRIVNEHIERGGDINGTCQNHRRAVDNNGKNPLTKLVELYSEQESLDGRKPKQILNMIKNVISCGADPYKQDDHGNSAMSLIQGMGQGIYQTNLVNAVQKGFNKMQSNHESQANIQPPSTRVSVDNLEQPSTSYGHSAG